MLIGMVALNPQAGNYASKNPEQFIAELLRGGCLGFKAQGDISNLPVGEIPRVIERLKKPSDQTKVMYDRKIKDIGSAMREHVCQDLEKGFDRTTVHVDEDTIPALEYIAKHAPELFENIVGVAVLTSQSDEMVQKYHGVSRRTLLLRRLHLGCKLGLKEIVCGVREVKALRVIFPGLRAFYTPGTRLPGKKRHDQKIVGTPRQAYLAGASWIVGRPIANADNPREEYEKYVRHSLGQQ